MKKTVTMLLLLVIALLAGCQTNQDTIKAALGDALIIGAEIEKMERADGNIDTADRIVVWVSAGQQIYDTGSYKDNCDLMLSVSDIAYDWLSEKYPDKPYMVFVAVLRSRLEGYCDEVTP